MASFVGSCVLNFLAPGNGPSSYPFIRGMVPTTVDWSTSGHVAVCKQRTSPGLPQRPTIAKSGDRLFLKVKRMKDGRRFVVAVAATQNHSHPRKSEKIVGCLWDSSNIADHFTTSSCNHLLSEILCGNPSWTGVLSYHCEISGQCFDGQGPIYLGSSEDSRALATDDR